MVFSALAAILLTQTVFAIEPPWPPSVTQAKFQAEAALAKTETACAATGSALDRIRTPLPLPSYLTSAQGMAEVQRKAAEAYELFKANYMDCDSEISKAVAALNDLEGSYQRSSLARSDAGTKGYRTYRRTLDRRLDLVVSRFDLFERFLSMRELLTTGRIK